MNKKLPFKTAGRVDDRHDVVMLLNGSTSTKYTESVVFTVSLRNPPKVRYPEK